MFYLADLNSKNREKNIEQFNNNVEKLKNYYSKGVATDNVRNGETQLWQIERGRGESVSGGNKGTYEWYTNKLYPKITEDTRSRRVESENRSAWAR